jgi:hypothetical protein
MLTSEPQHFVVEMNKLRGLGRHGSSRGHTAGKPAR